MKVIERVDITNSTADPSVPANVETDASNESSGGVTPRKSPTSVTRHVSAGADLSDEADRSFAGCGIVTVKRSVHGYKKLSMITRAELSRHELELPPMEYDSFGLWIDAEAEILGPFLGEKYGCGVHALSHALLAVAPLHIPCVRGDLDCDHSTFSPTRVCLFDNRAGGSGTCSELWKSLFVPNGLLESAIDLLSDCPTCRSDDTYDGGCPACLQSGECLKFNMDLSRCAALTIANRMLKRIKQSAEYRENSVAPQADAVLECKSPSRGRKRTGATDVGTRRKRARDQALRNAKNLSSARDRQIVVGRPSWPLDEEGRPGSTQFGAD